MAAKQKRMTAFTVNWGRGENPAEFKRNVLRVLDAGGDDAILGVQELDEADAPSEHFLLRTCLDPDDHLIGWNTYEPLIVPAHLTVRRSEVIPACSGLAKFSPARFFTEALVLDKDDPLIPPLLFMNHHAPRKTPRLAGRRAHCRMVHRQRLNYWYDRGISVIWTGDMNDTHYPALHRKEKTAARGALDYVRYVEHPEGAQLRVVQTGSVPMSIDGHDAQWARFAVSAPSED